MLLLVLFLLKTLTDLLWSRQEEGPSGLGANGLTSAALSVASAKLFNSMYERHSRRGFSVLPRDSFLWPNHLCREIDAAGMGDARGRFFSGRVSMITTCVPQVLPFELRVRAFQRLLEADKAQHGIADHGGHVIDVTCQRETIYEDSRETLEGGNMKHRFRFSIPFPKDHLAWVVYSQQTSTKTWVLNMAVL